MQKILLLLENNFEDMELLYPHYRFQEAGFLTHLAAPLANHTYLGKNGYPLASTHTLAEVESIQYAGVLCGGGWMPDKLRRDPKVKQLLQEFHRDQKLIAAICHGGWMPISAGIYKGVHVTGSPGIKDDLINGGALFEDAPVITDRHFVSSRKPDDLPQFMRACLEVLQAASR